MKINQEIQRLTQAKEDFKTKLIEKGVAVSDDELISDYPPKLDLIETGINPSGTIEINTNGVYNVTNYAVASVNVASSGGGVEIPSVTDLVCDSEGNVSWNAPNIDSLAEYNPTISYIVSVNDSEFETTNTSINVGSYLVDGTNTIYVKVKAIINHYDNGVNTSIEYSKPVEAIYILENEVAPKIGNLCKENNGNNIYMFGGYKVNTIYKFDTTTETKTLLSTTLPVASSDISCVTVNNYIYIFCEQKIYKFDTTTETLTTLSTTLLENVSYVYAHLFGTIVYIVGGHKNSDGTIYKFDTTTETITTATNKLSLKNFRVNNSGTAYGNSIYMFGGMYVESTISYAKYIVKFDTITETSTILSTQLPNLAVDIPTGTIYDFAYILGERDNKNFISNNILKFDYKSETFSYLSIQMPLQIRNACTCVVDNTMYVFCGSLNEYKIIKFVVN